MSDILHPKKQKIVLTLDAGGTNFVFSAIQNGQFIGKEITLPSMGHDLSLSLKQIIYGFEQLQKEIGKQANAISFAFPGPADYRAGIIGNLVNLPAFNGGVALGPMLEDHFGIPAYINNDGDLFALGEARFGFLPQVNAALANLQTHKRFKNLVGVTLGTGFGGGVVINGELLIGDNDAAAEVWSIQHPERPDIFSEESLSIRGVKRIFYEYTSLKDGYEPVDIAFIARDSNHPLHEAAVLSFRSFGNILGATLANIITIFDACVVIGGGISAAYPLFIETTLKRLNGSYRSLDGRTIPRMEVNVYDVEAETGFLNLAGSRPVHIQVPFSDRTILYDPVKRVGIGKTKLGTSKAVALGAFYFAVQQLQREEFTFGT